MSELKSAISNWMFKRSEEELWKPAFVPGCVHTDLYKNGLIPHPFVGTNETSLQWIDKLEWDYEAVFDGTAELLGHSRLEMVFEGLDTYADVYLNDTHILSADNMFRLWRVDVKPYIREKGNRLHIRFRSPIHEGLAKLEANGVRLPAPNDDSITGGLGDNRVSVFTRKAPYHYGWDWGPRFVTSGICKPVYLHGWSGVQIRDLYIRQDEISSIGAKITALLETESEEGGEYQLRLRAGDLEWVQHIILEQGSQQISWPITIEQPKLWWSRGLGDPNLYTFVASLLEMSNERANATVRTGLRSIKLILDEDKHGSTFFFEVNGIPVFAKGANHIPNDCFINEVTPERYRHEIASALDSNFNMLRVWGGGLYEQDIFYNLCDENGLLVWQDFMFACSMYPGDEAFLNNVREEAEDNVRRLRNHPSIALWCGNNEIDTAWSQYAVNNSGWGWKKLYTAEQRERIWAEYEAVFHQVLPEVVTTLAPDIAYWPSSPMQRVTRNVEQHATNNSAHGDIHYWSVWHGQEPFEQYNDNIGRFMSEYGFQSFPEYKSVRAYAKETDMALNSEVMLHHQKNNRGNFLIKDYADRYMKKPKDFSSFLYISQVLQAQAMKQAVEAHRRSMDYCMGTLYWQLNDCWPVASWASMDYYGRWKAAQYTVKRCFERLLMSIHQIDNTINFHVISDCGEALDGTLIWGLYNFEGRLLKQDSTAVRVDARSACLVVSLSDEQLGAYDPKCSILVGRFVVADRDLASSEHYFVYTKELNLENPVIEIEEVGGSEGTAFILTAQRLAKHVQLQTEEEGIFTDNFFDLVPGIPKVVQFRRREASSVCFVPTSPGELTVHSMFDYV